MNAKPTVEDLGIDPDAQTWQHSGEGEGAIEVAFVAGAGAGAGGGAGSGASPGGASPGGDAARADWVLMRVAGDPADRVLVFDRNEWECFLDGARNGEFDDAAGDAPALAWPYRAPGLAGLAGLAVMGGLGGGPRSELRCALPS